MAPPKTSQLLETLVRAATAIVEESGRREVTLRSVAERVTAEVRRISHTAAFAHLSGQLELLTHVAEGGWIRLREELAAATGGCAPAERLVELGVVYRRFAVTHANLFRVMYDQEMWERIMAPADGREVAAVAGERQGATRRSSGFKHPQVLDRVREHRDLTFALFVEAVEEGIREGVFRRDDGLVLMARSIAALAHGLAMEALDEQLPEDEVRPILSLAVDGLQDR